MLVLMSLFVLHRLLLPVDGHQRNLPDLVDLEDHTSILNHT